MDNILNTAPCGFLTLSDDGIILAVNATLLELLEYEPDGLRGLHIDSILPVASRVLFHTYLLPRLEIHSRIDEVFLSLQSTSGRDVPVLINAIRRERERIIVYDYVLMPIHQRIHIEDQALNAKKAAEEALHNSEIKFRSIFERSVDAIGVSKNGMHVFTNPSYASMFGYESADELIGIPVLDLIAPKSREMVLKNIQERAAGNFVPSDYEAFALRKDGSTFIMDVRVSTYTLQGEQYTLVILRDITERKQAEEALIESEEKFQTIFKAAPGSMMLSSLPDGKTIEVNDNFSLITGYSREEALGKTTADLSMWADPDTRVRFLSILQPEGMVSDFEADLNHKSGVIRNGLLSGRILTVQGKKYLISTFYDITERKQAAEDIRLRAEQLTTLNVIGRRVTSSLSVDEVAQTALDEIVRAVSPDLAMFFIREDDKLILHSSRSPNDTLLHKETPLHRVGECLCGLAVSEAQAIYSKNIRMDMRCTWKECKEAGVISFAAIPLRAGDSVLGVIGLASKVERDFTETATFLETLADQIAAGLQNARLYKTAQSRLSELSALYKTSQSLQKLLTPESLSQEIVELLEKTLSYEYGAVLLIEEPGRRLIPFAIVGLAHGEEFVRDDKERIASHEVQVGKGVTGWVAEHGESALIADVQSDPRYYGLRENIRSEMCVPLRSSDRIIGVINVESPRLNAYNENDLRVLETVAAQISVSIQNARLLESELKRRQEAEALQRATAAITSSLDLKNILESLLEQLSAVVPLDSASVILHENEQLVLVAAQGFAHPERVMGQEFPAGDPLSKIMFETRRFIIIPNVREDTRFKHWGETSLIKGWMGIPLIVQEQVIGYLTVDSQTVDAYNESHAELAQSFANQAAVAIHNARLLDETRLSRDRLADLTRKLVEAQETEARAIGRELHDQIGQMLTALKLTLEIAPQLPPESARKKYAQAHELVDDLMARVSVLSLELRPPMLDDLGLIPALLWHVNRYQEQSGIEVDFKHSGVEGKRYDPQIETTAYRIIQEALTNVTRHAHATRVRLEVCVAGRQMEIQIEDNGQGFDPKAALEKNRGLRGMRERAALIGGTFLIESQPGKGTKNFIRLPISNQWVVE